MHDTSRAFLVASRYLDQLSTVAGSPDPSEILRKFREAFYVCMRRRSDALFELSDAILTADSIHSLPYLSLEGVHRRGWGSLYAVLSKGSIDAETFRGLLASRDPDAGDTLVYAVDVSAWPLCGSTTAAACFPEVKVEAQNGVA